MANGDNGNGRSVTWKWLVGILMVIVLAVTGGIISDTRSGISEAKAKCETLQKEKVDKEQYRIDLAEIKNDLKTLIRMQVVNK